MNARLRASLARLGSLAPLATGCGSAFFGHIIEPLLNVLATILINGFAAAELCGIEQSRWREEALQMIPITHWRFDLADAKRQCANQLPTTLALSVGGAMF
jgi:hypothetical protein